MSIANDVPDLKTPGAPPDVSPRLTLRMKGMFLFLALSLYVLVAAVLLVGEAVRLLERNLELREQAVAEAAIAESNAELLRIISMFGESTTAGLDRTALAAARQTLEEIAGASAAWRGSGEALFERLERVRAQFRSADNEFGRAADAVRELESAFAQRGSELRRRVQEGEVSFRGRLETIIWVAVVVALLGLATFGAFLTLFFGRIAHDLWRLQARAMDVVRGYRGPPLDAEREDEVGVLMRAVNRMAADLDARERQIAMGRMQQFHQERMALLGGIAAGVAHEIGNPVAGIAAIAAEAEAARRRGAPPELDAELLLELAQRVASVTRQLGDAVTPRSSEYGPLALNPAVESVTALLRFDQRFKRIDFALDLDRALPLVTAVEDEIVQLLMHLMVNAAEALEEARGTAPRIGVATRRDRDWVELSVSDNGCGMDEQTLARAFEPFFTTKAAGRGNGLGLDACRRIVEGSGGAITMHSRAGEGTRAVCRFPAFEAAPRFADVAGL